MLNSTHSSCRCSLQSTRHLLARRWFRQHKTKFETAVFDAIVVGRWSVFGFHFLFFRYAFIFAHDRFPCLITVVLTLLFKWSIESSSWATAVMWDIITTYECQRPKFDVDTNQPLQQEVLIMRTPSCVAAVDVLINGQALPTQVQRSPLTHFAICPVLVVRLSIPSIAPLRALAELSYGCFQVPTLLPFPIWGYTNLLYDGAIFTQLYFVI